MDAAEKTLRELCRAVIAYDDSILGRAASGEYDLSKEGFGIARGEDLDRLYHDMVNIARETASKLQPTEGS